MRKNIRKPVVVTEALLENYDKLPDLYTQDFMVNIDKINDIQILKVF